MTADEALARALDQQLEATRAQRDAGGLPPGVDADQGAILPLVELAAALSRLPLVPGPRPEFRAALAERLRTAPAPAMAAPVSAATAPVAAEPAEGTGALVRALDDWLEARPGDRACRRDGLFAELRPLADVALAMETAGLSAAPSPEFRRSLARRLAQAPPPASLRAERAGSPHSWFRRLRRSTAFGAAAAATVIAFLAAGATYASAGALPGQPLYPVKRTVESARLWLADYDAAMRLYMRFGDRRLHEALAVPDQAGSMLAEFNHAATAALAESDRALARGAEREAITEPLLAWFVSARLRLLEGRPALPPMAWRGTMALVDEAIRTLSAQQPFSAAPVPRLDTYGAGAPLRTVRGLSAVSARLPSRAAYAPPSLDAPAAASRAAAAAIQTATRDAGMAAGPPEAQVAPPPGARHPAGASERHAPAPTEPARQVPAPTESARQAPAPTATRQAPPATAEPTERSVAPSPSPPPESPPESPAPPIVTTAPTAAPVEPMPDTPTPTATPTEAPTATPTVPVINKPPTVLDVRCDDQIIELYGSTTCHVTAVDPEGEPLHYLWVSDAPQMLNERQKDAIYYAAWGIGGGKMRVGIVVYVSDREQFDIDDPSTARGETFVVVRSLDAVDP